MANGIIARMIQEQMCACGKPLHYADSAMRAIIQQLVDERGENIRIAVGDRTWLVPRHYIALHGIKAWELEKLGFPEIANNDAASQGMENG